MSRTRTITDEQILQAAVTVFISEGSSAPTSLIAERAGISEGSIYKRFETKDTLFRAAMCPPEPPEWISNLEERAGEGELRETLIELGLQFIAFFRKMLPRLMMLWSNPPVEGLGDCQERQHPALRCHNAVGGILEREMALGRARPGDPLMLARIFTGSLSHFVFTELAGFGQSFGHSEKYYVESLVELMLCKGEDQENHEKPA